MNLEECRQALESIGGLIIVDNDGYIKFFSKDIMNIIERVNAKDLPDDLIGKHISEIHPTSKIIKLLNEPFEEKITTYKMSGVLNITRILPLMQDNRRTGIIDLDLFRNNWEISKFLKQLESMELEESLKLPDTKREMEEQLNRISQKKYTIADLVGDSYVIKKLKNDIYKLAESSSTVLITGETGTGKEIVAHAIHSISGRQLHPFIEINCAAIPESLFESELFGYEEGTFTGAVKGGKAGVFEQANHGTLFLDEVDQIPYNMQPKLLRVLQEGEVTRIGGKKIPVDVRIIASTNKDLKAMVLNKQFREDLYYRLNVINIKTPALRDHREDIKSLINHRIKILNKVMDMDIEGISEKALTLLKQYDWPGNIRELFNVIERGVNMCESRMLDVNDFKDIFFDVNQKDAAQNDVGISTLDEIMRFTEKENIIKALRICDNNKTKAAEILGISRTSLHHKITRHNIHSENI
ncbi:MAG: sigma 54-interacting transcriptional regulator [Firmicutes bacterium]|nr:sigma 54-interacting transcriptional regulator [Bacillota bacterium]